MHRIVWFGLLGLVSCSKPGPVFLEGQGALSLMASLATPPPEDATPPEGDDLGLDVPVATAISYEVWPCGSDESTPPVAVEVAPLFDVSSDDFGFVDAAANLDGTQHHFADQYFLLDAGCYDVRVTPLDQFGDPYTPPCASGKRFDIEVRDGQTTEITTLIQCDGDETGGLDVVAALNEPPTLIDLAYSPSKFVDSCESVVACATAADPNNDPLEFVVFHRGNPNDESDDVVVDGSDAVITRTSTESGVDEVEFCIELPNDTLGEHAFEVEVYDLLSSPAPTGETRIEDWLAAYQNSTAESHDSLEFPLYVSSGDCQGYFVVSESVYTGDFASRSNDGSSGLENANRACREELREKDWLGKPAVEELTEDRVFAFLCDSEQCNNGYPDTNYFFARAGEVGVGGAMFRAIEGSTGEGLGPGDLLAWNAASYFGEDSLTYWTGRTAFFEPFLWPDDQGNQVAANCDEWSSDDVPEQPGLPEMGMRGTSEWNERGFDRWHVTASPCTDAHALVCWVHPPPTTLPL